VIRTLYYSRMLPQTSITTWLEWKEKPDNKMKDQLKKLLDLCKSTVPIAASKINPI